MKTILEKFLIPNFTRNWTKTHAYHEDNCTYFTRTCGHYRQSNINTICSTNCFIFLTIVARTTSERFTGIFGIASLTTAIMVSPIFAYFFIATQYSNTHNLFSTRIIGYCQHCLRINHKDII
nr:hypothetical protein DMDDKFKA_00169 [Haslea ostrearia]